MADQRGVERFGDFGVDVAGCVAKEQVMTRIISAVTNKVLWVHSMDSEIGFFMAKRE